MKATSIAKLMYALFGYRALPLIVKLLSIDETLLFINSLDDVE